MLRQGSKGFEVNKLQTKLKICGYDIDVDGVYGPSTSSTIKSFQADNNLKQDGIYGPNSAKVLYALPRMKYQEYWYNKQTQVIKMRRDKTTLDLIDVTSMTVKSLWNTLRKKPKLLVNGGLFDMKTGTDLNKMYDEYKSKGVGYYSKTGIKINDKISFGEYDNDRDFLGGSPTLLSNCKFLNEYTNLDSNFINGRHPRIGIGANDSYIYVVIVNGRSSIKKWYGATLKEFAIIFDELGCSDAINLDGGGSITVVTKLGLFLKFGGRKVANMLAFYQE